MCYTVSAVFQPSNGEMSFKLFLAIYIKWINQQNSKNVIQQNGEMSFKLLLAIYNELANNTVKL